MTTVQAEKIARRKLSLLQLAHELGDNGREFCGRADQPPRELFLQLEENEHRTTKVRRP